MTLAFLLLIVIIEFILIFLLSRQVFTLLYTLFFLPLKHLPHRQAGQTISNNIVSLLFLPGTVIHEFSHALVARLLRVEVHQIILYPHKDKKTGELKSGSIEIEQVDPFRLSLIGIAPLLVGLGILSLTVFYLFEFSLPLGDLRQIIEAFLLPKNYLLFLILFIVSLTMFTSRRDLKEFLITAPFILIFIAILYLVGFRVSFNQSLINRLQGPLTNLVFILGVTLMVDLVVYVFLFIPISLILALFGKKLG